MDVWYEIDEIEVRKDQCLCANCCHLGSCTIAHDAYELAKMRNIAFAVTRYPEFSIAQRTSR